MTTPLPRSPIRFIAFAALAALATALTAGLAAAADPSTPAPMLASRVTKAGVFKVAIDATYPPMEFEGPDGKATGFDVDFANELAKRLHARADFQVMNWEGILAGLASQRYDVIISSMNVTDERKQVADFVEYLQMAQVFVTKPGAPVKSNAELSGKVVVVQADTTSFNAVQRAKTDGVAIKDIKAFQLATEAFQALKAGQGEVIVIDEPVARYYVKQDPKSFAISGQALAPEPVGIAVRKADADVRDALRAAVDEVKHDGTFQRISEKWFGTTLGTP